MWHSKNQTSVAASATVTAVCESSGVLPNNLPNHQLQQSAPPFEVPFCSPIPTKANHSQLQQHPPAKMVNRLKSLVSKKKKRFQADGFDLDLSYISPRIIAMGFPAERIEGLYRNHIDEVSRFFEMRHKGHYKIYHLCNERDFNECRFSGPVVRYPFSDHNAPQFEQILALCQDVMQFLQQHPENVVAINCKAGKGRTGVMVCACLLELQEAKNADEALRLYAEKRTRNGQGVTIPSQRRYVQYYSRLLSSSPKLNYEPTPLRLTSVRIEGLPHQLHGIQSFDLSISIYDNRSSINHNHDATTADEVSHSQASSSSSTTYSGNTTSMTSPAVATSTVGVPIEGFASLDYVSHRHSDVTTCQIPCSTHHSDSGSYLIRLDEPVTVFEDFRIKIKAKTGVLTKKIGQCWLNTFFILLDDSTATGVSSSGSTSSPSSFSAAKTIPNTLDCCSVSDSNSGSSGSSLDSSASTASSTSSSLRNSPPHFTGVNEEEEEEDVVVVVEEKHKLEIEEDGEREIDGEVEEEEGEEEEDELPTLTSNSTLLQPCPSSASPPPPPPVLVSGSGGSSLGDPTAATNPMLRRSSNPFRFTASKAAGVSMPFISIPKKDNNSSSSYGNFTKKNSPNTNLMLAPSLSTQLATPLAVRVLELSQSDLDATFKVKGKKGEEFKVLFEFIREAPCSQPIPTCSTVNFPNPIINTVNTTTSCPIQRPMAMDLEGVEELEKEARQQVAEEARIENAAVSPSCLRHHHHHHQRNHPFHCPSESTTNQTGALVS